MSAVIIPFPRTPDGRAMLRYFIAPFRSSPDMRLFLATEDDWDEIAKVQRRRGNEIPQPRREA